MNVHYISALLAVVVLGFLAYLGTEVLGLQSLFGIFIPYLAVCVFIVGAIMKVMNWAKSPVPFRIPTTCGQGKSLDWIAQNKIDNPSSTVGVVVRMFFEVLLFRSLFRNTKAGIKEGKITYEWEIFLWVGALAFHYSFLTVLVRHMRFFLEPVPYCIKIVETLDGFFQVGLPGVLLSGVVLLAAVLFLLARRVVMPQISYISLMADYFPLFLIIGIAGTGLYMRYFARVDVVAIKELTMGLVTFKASVPAGVNSIVFVHLFFVSVLFAYFPFSKLMHAGGIFLSPTRNMASNNRMVRHVNPWNPELKFHTYAAYEDDFREKMIEAGLPVDKEA
ncbi:MAG: sulfate reduction electron transfer complex DsrMKJOP subunit DsrM [Proteobacteria bacterium]|nr:sulfate reduction electron transfer complex DsrMKJOP subunit DsrM [Pseudomonadota bacterium]